MVSNVIVVDFKSRRAITPPLLEYMPAEEDLLLEDMVFYLSEKNRERIRLACIQGKGSMKENRIAVEDVTQERIKSFQHTSIKDLCDLILHCDPKMWPARPNNFGAAWIVLFDRFKKLRHLSSEIKRIHART